MGFKPRASITRGFDGAALTEAILSQVQDSDCDDDALSWRYIEAISRVRALAQPGGELGRRLAACHDEYCKGTPPGDELRRRLRELRGLAPTATWGVAPPFPLAEWSASLVRLHCDTAGFLDEYDQQTRLAVARYGPAYLLAWTDVPAALVPLLRIPLGDPLPASAELDALLTAALREANSVYGNLRVDRGALDESSAAALCASFATALCDARIVEEPARSPAPAATIAPPDWDREVDALHALCVESLARFASEHPGEGLAQLVFDCDPPADYVLVSLDTAADFAARSAAVERAVIERRRVQAADPRGWRTAHHYFGQPATDAHDPGDFEHQFFAEHRIARLEAYVRAGAAPPVRDDSEEVYERGNLRMMFFRVLDRLTSEGALDRYPAWRPFHLGYAFHSEPPVILFTVRP